MSLFTPEMSKECPADEPLAFFFGGIGDARHLYYTLTKLAASEHGKRPKRDIHFTINDIVPDVFARDLIILVLFDELSHTINDSSISKATKLENDKKIASLFFLYIFQLVPAYVNDELQRVISKTILLLEGQGQEKIPPWIHISSDICDAILPLLQSWQADVFALYSTLEVLTRAKTDAQNHTAKMASLIQGMNMAGVREPEETPEERDYSDTLLVSPPRNVLDAFEPELARLLELPRSKSRLKKIEQHVRKNWKINATILNVAAEKAEYVSDRGHNPFEFGKDIIKCFDLSADLVKTDGLYASGKIFFTSVAVSLAELRGHIFVETQLGDATQLMEDIRLGLAKNRESSWPVLYDYVHMSNVP
jgi:hypothetical protein